MFTKCEVTATKGSHPWAVILAGGEGRRLLPLTRLISGDDRPKQFCPIFGGKSLLAHTRARLADAIARDDTMFVVTKAHESFYADELADVRAPRIIVQPSNKGTAAAIAYAVLRIIDDDEDGVVAFFPSDHYYSDEKRFVSAVKSAMEMATEHPDSLILLGAEPTHAEIEYGWIEPGPSAGLRYGEQLLCVNRFWEKPTLVMAQTLQQRGCLWNTFVMVGRARTFVELLRSTVPALLRAFTVTWQDGEAEGAYEFLPSVDFSQQVLSKCTGRLLVLRLTDVGWSDLGHPHRVISTLERAGVAIHRGAALRIGCTVPCSSPEAKGSFVV